MLEQLSNKIPRKCRRYSKEFKAEIFAACVQPVASVCCVSLANELNANLVHKWRCEAEATITGHFGAPDFLPGVNAW